MGKRKALFSIPVLIQTARDVCWDVYACFIDFEKAIAKVQLHKLFQIFIESGIVKKYYNLRYSDDTVLIPEVLRHYRN